MVIFVQIFLDYKYLLFNIQSKMYIHIYSKYVNKYKFVMFYFILL